jgi:hypothetical protein
MRHQCGQRLLIRIRRGSAFPTCRKSLAIPATLRNGGPANWGRRSWIAIAGAAFDRGGLRLPVHREALSAILSEFGYYAEKSVT